MPKNLTFVKNIQKFNENRQGFYNVFCSRMCLLKLKRLMCNRNPNPNHKNNPHLSTDVDKCVDNSETV